MTETISEAKRQVRPLPPSDWVTVSTKENLVMGSPFYDDITAFREQLRSRRDTGRECWGCGDRTETLTAFKASKDLSSMGLLSPGLKASIRLCPKCAVRYMNSFNLAREKKRGGTGKPYLW